MINRRQFVVSKAAYKGKDFETIALNENLVLSYHKELKVNIIDKKKPVILIGEAWQIDNSKESPVDELKQLSDVITNISDEEIYNMDKSWCGRYILIFGNKIYLDAIGSLGVFYSKDAFSSSYSILCDVMGIKDKYPDKLFGISLGFQPGVLTLHNEIKRMLPSQVYDYVNSEILYRKLLCSNEFAKLDKEQIMNMFIKSFSTSLQNLQKQINGDIWLALTGGHDSRTLVSLMEYAGVSYNCFTLEVDNMTFGDKELPKTIAQQLGRRHEYIQRKKNKFSLRRFNEYIKHSNGFAKDQDIISYSYGQYNELTKYGKNIVVLRSGIWEAFVDFFRKNLDADGRLSLEIMKERNILLEVDKRTTDSLVDYFDYIRNNDEKEISEVNRYYWEIRTGCWLSSIEQSCDIIENIVFLQPCNSRMLLSMLMLLAKDEKEPWKKHHQEEIIEKSCNILMKIDFDSNYKKNVSNRTLIQKVSSKVLFNLYIILLYGIKGWLLPRKVLLMKK